MGTWGDSIFADDEAQDIYHHYRRLYNQGKDHPAVRREMERAWSESISDSDDGPLFWFAVARAQWEYGALDKDVLGHVKEIAKKGLGLDRWQEAGARALARRKEIVREFLEKIRRPNPKPKKRKVERRYPPIYQPGDCLAIRLSDDTFGAVLVLAIDDTHHTEGIDFVGFLEWHAKKKPPLDLFQQRRWLGHKKKRSIDPDVMMCLARFHRREKKNIEQIGHVPLRKDDPKYTRTGRMGGWDNVRRDLEIYYGLRSHGDESA